MSNLLMYTDPDTGEYNIVDAPPHVHEDAIQFLWYLDTSTTMAQPLQQHMRWNNATESLVTSIAISKYATDNAYTYLLLRGLTTGDMIFAQWKNGASYRTRFRVSGAVTDNSDWIQIPVTYIEGGTVPRGQDVWMRFIYGAAGSTAQDARYLKLDGTTTMTGPFTTTANATIDSDRLTVGKSTGDNALWFRAAAGNKASLVFVNAGNSYWRWAIRKSSDAESSGNAGSNLEIVPISDTNAYLPVSMTINRATGQVSFGNKITALAFDSSTQDLHVGFNGSGMYVTDKAESVYKPLYVSDLNAAGKVAASGAVSGSTVSASGGMGATGAVTSEALMQVNNAQGFVSHNPSVAVASMGAFNLNGGYAMKFTDGWSANTGNLAAIQAGGVSLGSVVAASATDVTSHLAVYSTTYGINVISGTVQVVAAGVAELGVTSNKLIVAGTGISYTGASAVTGGTNTIAMRWSSPNINGGVDNANTCVMGTVSARKWKSAILDLKKALNTVSRLRPVEYNAKDIDGTVKTGHRHIGLVADEVRPVIPSAVVGEGDSGSVNYLSLVPLLIGAVQELTTRIEELEARA